MDNGIEQEDIIINKPFPLFKGLHKIESGKIYEAVSQNKGSSTQNILIQIELQQVKLNDKLQYMAYFKDVTFGVLYEQIKGKELLQNMIDSTLYNKLSRPLERVVDTCQNFERSSELIKFEKSLKLHKDQLLSTKLCSILYQS